MKYCFSSFYFLFGRKHWYRRDFKCLFSECTSSPHDSLTRDPGKSFTTAIDEIIRYIKFNKRHAPEFTNVCIARFYSNETITCVPTVDDVFLMCTTIATQAHTPAGKSTSFANALGPREKSITRRSRYGCYVRMRRTTRRISDRIRRRRERRRRQEHKQ